MTEKKRPHTPPPLDSQDEKQLKTPTKTPFFSPSKQKQKKVLYDRFIPQRGVEATQQFLCHGESLGSPTKFNQKQKEDQDALKGFPHYLIIEEANRIYSQVLKSEILGSPPPDPSGKEKILNFSSSSSSHLSSVRRLDFSLNSKDLQYSLSPISPTSQKTLQSPRKQPRHISKIPYKVLDAPELADDFYLNLVDWGSQNLLSVGLGSCVYLWSAHTSRVTKLCDLGPYDSITSVQWMDTGTHLAVGTNRGLCQIWDAKKLKKIRTLSGHTSRVGCLAWQENILSSGSRDRYILHRDIRAQESFMRKLSGHKQEVCGLKWNSEFTQLASGGNDNRLIVWDKMQETPSMKFSEHSAAVKAIAWSPHQHGLLASGGGTADRKIRFWNTLTGSPLNCIDTGSQVCNLSWSKTMNEIVSTHGYSQNQIVIWKYPTMHPVATLTGHTYRVLYLAMSPDGQNVVTGAGDETLRFWNVFSKKSEKGEEESLLNPPSSSQIR